MNQEKTNLVRAYLREILDGGEKYEVMSAAETIGPPGLVTEATSQEMDLALEGLDRVIADKELDEGQVSALEAIVLPRYRPVVDVLNDSFHQPPPPWTHLGSGDYRRRIEDAVPSIGRVEVPGHPSIPYAGTAFVVGPGLLMTNRHVAEIFTAGLGRRDIVFRPGLGAAVDFKQEVYPSPPALAKVRRVLMIHPYWDCALLQVEGLPGGRGHLTLEGREPEEWRTREVTVIGYPAQDSRNDIQLQNRIFRGIYQRKRLQPGKLTGQAVIQSFGNSVEAITHDSSTLGGNSGSAVIDLTTGRVIGLHFAGIYLRANYAVPTWELARDARVVDAGVVFHDAPARGMAPWEPEWKRADPEPKTASPAPSVVQARKEAVDERETADWFEQATDAQLLDLLEREPERTRARLNGVLGDEDAAELIGDLGAERSLSRELFGYPEPDLNVPEIVFLHGIMGSHLANRWGAGRRVWFSVRALIAGNMAEKLQLDEDGLTDAAPDLRLGPDGHVKSAYGKAVRRWRKAGFVVHEFSFDWRKPVKVSADRLAGFIEQLAAGNPSRRFALVAHSMGGLVASLYAARHRRWSDRIQRAVFAGSPLGGSYAPLEAILGSYPFFKTLATLSRQDDIPDLQRLAKGLPGLIDMLPNPALFDGAGELYQCGAWPGSDAPAQRWLDASRALKAEILESPLLTRTSGIVSRQYGTVASSIHNGRLEAGPRNGVGDGTVPLRAAAVAELAELYEASGYRHSDLYKDDAVIQAVADLLRFGVTRVLPRLSFADIDFDAVVPEAEAFIVNEAAMSGVQRRFNSGTLRIADLEWILDPLRGSPRE